MPDPNIFDIQCPSCGESFQTQMIPRAPEVRGLLTPIDNITVYRITSEEMKAFLMQKVQYYMPNTKLQFGVKYFEKKKKTKKDPHRSYATITIAFSSDVLEKKVENEGWFNRIGDNDLNHPEFIKDVRRGMIEKYQYDRRGIEDVLSDYKLLEELEEATGLTQNDVETEIKPYLIPRRVPTPANESWILFAARPESIIEDMLENPDDNKIHGRMIISSVNPINKDVVEYIVYVHQNQQKNFENPFIRKMLQSGGKKD